MPLSKFTPEQAEEVAQAFAREGREKDIAEVRRGEQFRVEYQRRNP